MPGPTDVAALHAGNRAAWDEGAAAYAAWVDGDITFLRAGGVALLPPEVATLGDLRGRCRRAIHLQCAAGKDTLSLWNLGAAEVVGLDISPAMLALARRKSDALGAQARWVGGDVLDAPRELDGTADLVYTGKGALNWLHDLEAWGGVVARLLAPGGRLFLFEGHPFTWILDHAAAEPRLDPRYGDYFSRRAEPEQGWTAGYIGDLGRPTEELAVKYERHWNFGAVFAALLGAGLRIAAFAEYPDPYWEQFPNMPAEVVAKLPNTYGLVARKD